MTRMRVLTKVDSKKSHKHTAPRHLRFSIGDFTTNDVDEFKFQFYGLRYVQNVTQERIVCV